MDRRIQKTTAKSGRSKRRITTQEQKWSVFNSSSPASHNPIPPAVPKTKPDDEKFSENLSSPNSTDSRLSQSTPMPLAQAAAPDHDSETQPVDDATERQQRGDPAGSITPPQTPSPPSVIKMTPSPTVAPTTDPLQPPHQTTAPEQVQKHTPAPAGHGQQDQSHDATHEILSSDPDQSSLPDTKDSASPSGDDASEDLLQSDNESQQSDRSATEPPAPPPLPYLGPAPYRPGYTPEKRLNYRLQRLGLKIVETTLTDGNCQFDAVAITNNEPGQSSQYRQRAVVEMRDNADRWAGFVCTRPNETPATALNLELARLALLGEWGNHLSLQALAQTYDVTIWIVRVEGAITRLGTGDRVLVLAFIPELHYFATTKLQYYLL
jgi:hypothetical protein